MFFTKAKNKQMPLNKKSKFFGGWEVDFSNKDELTRFIVTHATDKNGLDFFSSVQTGLEFIIDNQKIIEVYEHAEGTKELHEEFTPDSKSLSPINLPINDWAEHEIFSLEKSKEGEHTLGGEVPSNFELPTHEKLFSPFQYIGQINCKDARFNWLGLDVLNIVFPVYECCNTGIFLDYSNPEKPTIINPETFSDAWKDNVPKNVEKIIFQKAHFKTKDYIDIDKYENSEDVILCGVPLWYQYPSVPVCPKTKKIMKYVCTINSDTNLKSLNKETNEQLGEWDYLIFGDQGHLFVFWEPDSKVLHLETQW